MLPMVAFTYGIGELAFGAYSGWLPSIKGTPGSIVVFALLCLGLTLACVGTFGHRMLFLLRWLLFITLALVFVRYVVIDPIGALLFGIGEGLPGQQPQRLIVQMVALCILAGPVAVVLTLGQTLFVGSTGRSAARWFPLHCAMTAIAATLLWSHSGIALNYQPLTGVLLAAPGFAYAGFATRPPTSPGGLLKRFSVALSSGLLAAWLAVCLIWLADGRPARDAALWPIFATTGHMSFADRRALREAMTRERGGTVMRIGDVHYRFPEGAIRDAVVWRADQHPAYRAVELYVDLTGLVPGWPSDQDVALVRIDAIARHIPQESACRGADDPYGRRRLGTARWPSCNARLWHRGNVVRMIYPLPAHDYLPEMKAHLGRLLDQYVVDG
jgi:hypothetical protein